MADRRRKHINQAEEAQKRRDFMLTVPNSPLELAEMVSTLRKFSLLTQAEFSSKIGIGLRVLKEIEAGRGNPTIETLNKIGRPFGLAVALIKPPSSYSRLS